MKDFHLKILAIIMIIFGIFGLSTLPFLSIIVQYIDSITGFSSGNGYLTNNMDYLFKSPLIYIGGFFVFSIILAIIYLVYSFFKGKRQTMRQSLKSTPPIIGDVASCIRPEDYLTMA